MKQLIGILIALTITGCSTTSHIDGSNVLLAPAAGNTASVSPDKVTIYLQTPTQSHQPIALLVASATVSSYSNIAKIEAELIKELKRQAANVGANGVIDVVREVVAGDKILTISGWGMTTRSNVTNAERRLNNAIRDHRQQGVISSDYLIIYRAKAIRLTNKPLGN